MGRPFALLLAPVLLVASGCADTDGRVRSVGPAGEFTIEGLDGVHALAAPDETEGHERSVGITLRVTNDGPGVRGIKDDCSEQWATVEVTRDGRSVYPGPQAVCDLYSVPSPLEPGGGRVDAVGWPLEVVDEEGSGRRAAPPGTYVVHARACVYDAPRDGAQRHCGAWQVEVVLG